MDDTRDATLGRMRWLSCLVIGVACSAACAGASEDPERGDPSFDPDELAAMAQEMVAAHNDVRANAAPAPDPALSPLVWDAEVAAVAQDWAEGCVFEHSTHNLGENLAFFSGEDSSATAVVELWASETASYDYASNSCAPGEQCGHYTQIVWRDSARVGCGAAQCALQGMEGRLWVCNYDPPGNFIGDRPY